MTTTEFIEALVEIFVRNSSYQVIVEDNDDWDYVMINLPGVLLGTFAFYTRPLPEIEVENIETKVHIYSLDPRFPVTDTGFHPISQATINMIESSF